MIGFYRVLPGIVGFYGILQGVKGFTGIFLKWFSRVYRVCNQALQRFVGFVIGLMGVMLFIGF